MDLGVDDPGGKQRPGGQQPGEHREHHDGGGRGHHAVASQGLTGLRGCQEPRVAAGRGLDPAGLGHPAVSERPRHLHRQDRPASGPERLRRRLPGAAHVPVAGQWRRPERHPPVRHPHGRLPAPGRPPPRLRGRARLDGGRGAGSPLSQPHRGAAVRTGSHRLGGGTGELHLGRPGRHLGCLRGPAPGASLRHAGRAGHRRAGARRAGRCHGGHDAGRRAERPSGLPSGDPGGQRRAVPPVLHVRGAHRLAARPRAQGHRGRPVPLGPATDVLPVVELPERHPGAAVRDRCAGRCGHEPLTDLDSGGAEAPYQHRALVHRPRELPDHPHARTGGPGPAGLRHDLHAALGPECEPCGRWHGPGRRALGQPADQGRRELLREPGSVHGTHQAAGGGRGRHRPSPEARRVPGRRRRRRSRAQPDR